MNSLWKTAAKSESHQKRPGRVAGYTGVVLERLCVDAFSNRPTLALCECEKKREEIAYESRLKQLLQRAPLPSGSSSQPFLLHDLCVLDLLVNRSCLFTNLEYSSKHIYYELRFWERSNPAVFHGWQNVKVFAMRPHSRLSFYPASSFPELIVLRAYFTFFVPTPPVLSFYSGLFMAGQARDLARAIAQSKFAVLAFVQVVATAHHGIHDPHGFQSDLKACCSVLIAMSSEVLQIIAYLGVLDVLE